MTILKQRNLKTNFFNEQNSDNDDIDMEITWQPGLKAKEEEKLLNSNKKKKKSKKVNLLKSEIEENDDDFSDDQRESLELLTVDDDIDAKRDYNLRDMIKSYKKSTRKKLSDPVETKDTFQ